MYNKKFLMFDGIKPFLNLRSKVICKESNLQIKYSNNLTLINK